jgi:UDP-glucose 4-epimerase
MKMLTNKRILITGGTGSLGKVLVRRLLSNELGTPQKIIVFSRDEAKQHAMRVDYLNKGSATDEVIYQNFRERLEFRIGDVRDFHSIAAALTEVDVVFNAAALKQVPACEYFPFQAVRTNIEGPENIVRAIQEHRLPIETVVGISTDKACKPVNVMGMSKAIQERVFVQANIRCYETRFICVRYGNVLASRGSVIPLFHDQITKGGPVTITVPEMTRFLLSLEQAVDTVLAAFRHANRGETYIPRVLSAKIIDIAEILIGNRPIEIIVTGIRPGEKIHEILISEEECHRTVNRENYYAILPILPELRINKSFEPAINGEYSSGLNIMNKEALNSLLICNKLMIEDNVFINGELLR